jgi:hypothetical protein
MMAFLVLSEALTGFTDKPLRRNCRKIREILSSDPGIDPINIKNDYFDWIKAMTRRRHSANSPQLARTTSRAKSSTR